MLAALSTRLLLDFDQEWELSRKMESELVEGNMRIVFSMPKHGDYLYSGAPSEPILAEAAAEEMELMRRNERPILSTLAEFVASGVIDKGERGELVARFIFTEAYDRAVLKRRSIPFGTARFSQAVPLRDFLAELFCAAVCDKIWESAADNGTSVKKFGTAFKHAYVRFTHFVRDHEENHISTYTLWAALARGMAVQRSPNQDVVDIAIPVVICEDPMKDKLDESNVTGILVQVRNTVDEDQFHVDEADIGEGQAFFPKDSKDCRPYVVIVMNLVVKDKASESMTVRTEEKRSGTARRLTRTTSDHPRFPIFAVGCSSSVYAVVEDKDKPLYTMLLVTRVSNESFSRF